MFLVWCVTTMVLLVYGNVLIVIMYKVLCDVCTVAYFHSGIWCLWHNFIFWFYSDIIYAKYVGWAHHPHSGYMFVGFIVFSYGRLERVHLPTSLPFWMAHHHNILPHYWLVYTMCYIHSGFHLKIISKCYLCYFI